MMLTALGGLAAAIALNLFLDRLSRSRGSAIVRVYRIALLLLAGLVLIAVATGSRLNPHLVVVSFVFGLAYLTLETLSAGFWGKIGFGTLTVAHLLLGGYLYTLAEIPYGDRPFAAISRNQPRPLTEAAQPEEWISGLPIIGGTTAAATQPRPADRDMPRAATPASATRRDVVVAWSDLQRLIERDSHIRDVLVGLRERQERDLSEVLANLNQISVTGTAMRRHAIPRENVENLLNDGAISSARYHTILETWELTDKDEKAFRSKQAEELFHGLLELMEDDDIDETHKVELIDFMIDRFAGDVRLIKPLIHLYDGLDAEYPRQKRLNREFLSLYLQKRRAILRGFAAIGRPGLQPLLDYRRKTISEIRYSQGKLDQFLAQTFGTRVRPLYGRAEAVRIRDFLNREKYPPLAKLSGPAYEQDYLRRSLLRITQENSLPPAGVPVMNLAAEQYAKIVQAFDQGWPDAIDALTIDRDPAVRANLAWYLAERKDPYTVPLVFELMQDSHPEVRRLAAVAAGNFRIVDMQSSNDLKFTEIVRMLVNYRTNADSFARAFAVSGLTTVGDRQKALYVIDLVLNDGTTANSMLGEAAPSWRSDDERAAVQSLVSTLAATPEEAYVKTQALKVLLAMDSQEALAILLHYLDHIYEVHGTRPGMLRFIVPHMTLPQEAENVEDLVLHLAARYREAPDPLQQPLKTLRAELSHAYSHHRSGEFFQYLSFLEAYDSREYKDYLAQTTEHVLLMRVEEYLRSTYGLWLVFWPLSLALLIIVQYGWGLTPRFGGTAGGAFGSGTNRHANPAADLRNRRQAPAAAVVPIKITSRGS
ncbi:MAG: HEAT repeat domain-containing protein [Methylotetracoccus sp.]